MKLKFLFVIALFVSCLTDSAGQDLAAILNSSKTAAEKAELITIQARRFFQTMKWNEAAQWQEEGIKLAVTTGIDTLAGKLYLDRGNLSIMQGKPKQALDYLLKGNTHLGRTTAWYHLGSCFLLTAKSFARLEDTDSALYYFRKAEETYNKVNSYNNWATYVEMGTFFGSAENHEEARKYFEKAYQITKQGGNRINHGLTMYNLASFYYKRNMTAEFARLYNEQQDYYNNSKKDFSKDPVHNFLKMDWGNKTLEEKVAFLLSVKKTLLAQNLVTNGSNINEEIALLYENEKKYDEALKYIRESIELSKRDSSFANQYIYSKVAYRLLKKAGKSFEAVEMADRMIALKDSVTRIQNLQLSMELDARYLSEKKEKEIELLNANNEIARKEIALLNSQKKLTDIELLHQFELQKALARENELMDSVVAQEKRNNELLSRENELKNSELQKESALKASLNRENDLKAMQLKKERNTRTGLIMAAGLLLLAGGVILFQYRKQRIKNNVIQKQSDDMQVLMKEIHHRVKNNLQVISSLLDLQSMTIADNQASEAVKEGKNRVQSMALIHQNLYSEGNIKGIRTKEYISNLLQSLCDSYNVTNDKVKVKTDIDDLNLDVDTMIPLGLVLNELVSNTLKYAFKDGVAGELNVVLKKQPEHLLLRVSDNGAGYPEGVNIKEGKSFGMKMIRAFAQKLKANLNIYNNNGAVTEMLITKYNLA
jgi:two-component sensor histidine kinase